MKDAMANLLRRGFSQCLRSFRGWGLGGVPMVRRIEQAMRNKLISECADVLGHTMHLDANDILSLSINGIYEDLATEVVQREVAPGDVVLDIGSHIGYYTLICARLVGPRGRVYAFEPDPENFGLLQRNVRHNGYENVVLVQKAVADRTDSTALYLSEDNSGDHRLYDSRDGRKAVMVSTTALDDYFGGYDGRISFVKMDIQGAEHAALCGMQRLLEANRAVKIMTEFWPAGLKQSGVEPGDYLRMLIDHRFRLFDLNEAKGRVVPTSSSELLKELRSGGRTSANLLCVRDRALE